MAEQLLHDLRRHLAAQQFGGTGVPEQVRREPHTGSALTESEENSLAIASNESFGGSIVETGSDSYRLAHTRAQQATSQI